MAKMMIEDLHPIRKTHIDDAFYHLCLPINFMRKCCTKSKEDHLNERK
jgi:hypothetical protein